MKIGIGYDVHRTELGRKLFLGGVEIQSQFGLAGHSDADVLIHAVIDAILGALGKGDIGEFFPDTDAKYKGISSVILLKEIVGLLKKENKKILNLDCNIILESPKLMQIKPFIKESLASILQIDSSLVNVKAKTNEKLGYLGASEAIEAQAVVLVG